MSSAVGLPMEQTWPVEPIRGVYSSGFECVHAMPYFWQRAASISYRSMTYY